MSISRLVVLSILASGVTACASPISYQAYSCQQLQAEALALEAKSKTMSDNAVALAVISLEAASERKSCNIRYK
jgi:hypothetical protein